jgi:flagellar protein FlgJ
MAVNGMSGINMYSAGIGGFESGYTASRSAKLAEDADRFSKMLETEQRMGDALQNAAKPETQARIVESGRLNGDYTSTFRGTFTSPSDKAAAPSGMAHNAPNDATIDKTSVLYEKALEFESYFVKIMLSSMRSSVTKTNLIGEENSFAQTMYEDMLYDELAVTMTKNAGFGLADQIYLELYDK